MHQRFGGRIAGEQGGGGDVCLGFLGGVCFRQSLDLAGGHLVDSRQLPFDELLQLRLDLRQRLRSWAWTAWPAAELLE